MKCLEIFEIEQIYNILNSLICNLLCSKVNSKLRKMQQQQLRFQQEKNKIIYLKDDREENYALRVLLSCCYKTLEISNSSY